MIPTIEFEHRSDTGPVMKENEFSLAFAKKLRQLVAEYEIKCTADHLVIDDRTADAIYKAGVELLADVGMYNADTQRVVKLSKEEIEQIAKEILEGPRKQTFGDSDGKIVIQARSAEDPRTPVLAIGPAGVPSTEELYIPYVQSFYQEEWNQAIQWTCGLDAYKGVKAKAGTPSEIYVGKGEIELLKEVGRRVGKPVTNWLILSTTTSVGGVLSCFYPGGLEPHNTQIAIHLLPELKLDWSRLRLAMYCESRGVIPWTSGFSVIGMLSRGPEDAAVGAMASLLGQLAYGHGTIGMIGVMPINGDLAQRPVLWAATAAARGVERNIGLPIGGFVQSKAGACTELAFYEKAAIVLAEVAFGAAFIWGSGCRNGVGMNVTAGLEGRLSGETALAVTGMSRESSSELFNKIMTKIEGKLEQAPPGKTFAECYDIEKVEPTSEYLAVYDKAKSELARLGVPYK
ncbi:MAG: monomethylamine:corrinoid methyltransferase [Anaerolineales bacterium]|jgi:methylamine--corrinoid protein Co-methyltransferase